MDTAAPRFRDGAFRARLIAALAAVGGLLILLTTLPRVSVWLDRFTAVITPFGIREASQVASIVIGVGLLTLAGQLDRRKHLAWLITIVLFGLSVWFNLTRGHHPTSSGYSLLMVALLWFTRDEFRAPGDPPTLLEFVRWTTIWFGAVLVFGLAALFLERDHLSMNFAAWGRLFTDEIHQSLGTRIARLIVSMLSPFFQIKSLRTFNERFHPDWVPRVIAFDDRRSLPRVAILFGGVEGFLQTPVIGKYLLPKTVAHPAALDRD